MPSRSPREALSPRASSTIAPPAVALGTTSNKTWSSTSSRHHASRPTSLGARKTTGCSRVIHCTMPRKCATTGAPRWCTTRSHRPRGTSITTSSWPQVSLRGPSTSSYKLGRSCIIRLPRSRQASLASIPVSSFRARASPQVPGLATRPNPRKRTRWKPSRRPSCRSSASTSGRLSA